MVNHIHLIVVPHRKDSLHRVLKPLHTNYANRFNRRFKWTGHIWQGRYFSSLLDKNYMWAAIRYVENNPVRAKLVKQAEDYRWSSAGAHCGLRSDSVLTCDSFWNKKIGKTCR